MPRAVVYNRQGGPEVLELVEADTVYPESGQVSIEVKAAGLNPFDFKLRSGIIPMPVEFPRGIGTDFAGVVTGVSASATYADGRPIHIGDEVLGWSDGGTMRDQLVVPTANVARKPAGLSWELAGSLATAVLTADASIALMNPQAGDTVVVSAAAGAVGLVYCQLAINAGARVIGTASAANHDYLSALGVEPLNYGAGLVERLHAVTPNGVTFAQDNWGREFIDDMLEYGLAPEKICTIVDHKATAELGLSNPGRYERSTATLESLAQQFASIDLVLPIERAFPLTEFREAFELLESRHLRGKVVLVP